MNHMSPVMDRLDSDAQLVAILNSCLQLHKITRNSRKSIMTYNHFTVHPFLEALTCLLKCNFILKKECGPMPNVMATLPNIGHAIC